MHKRRMSCAFILFVNIFLNSSTIVAQVTTSSETEKLVHLALDEFIKSQSFNSFHDRRHPNANGTMELHLVVKGKKVESIFVDSTSNLDPTFVNAFSNYIKDMEFDFKLPKGQREKVKHQFNIQ
jgi:hypothetical protein